MNHVLRTPVAAAVLLACAASALPLAAHAQTTEPQRVEITGSAIKRIDAETAVPVTVYRMDDLKQQGVNSVEQVIQNLSYSTSLTSTAQVVGSGTGGASFADLRGIGGNKTLVLLNGRRIANNALEGSIPDLNMIPFAALERVEVLRDGASSLYGTDAIGGVINFITRRNYDAGEITLNAEVPEQSGGKRYGANGAIGFGDLAGSGFNLLGVFDVQRQERIGSQQRGFGSRGFIPERGFDGTSGTTFPANYSQTQTVGGVPTTFNANPSFPGCAPIGQGGSINTGTSATNCRFDPTPYTDLVPKSERASFFGKASMALGTEHTLNAEYFITRNTVYSNIGPVPQTGNTVFATSPFFPGGGITPAPTNFTIDPTLPISVNWRATDAGPRSGTNENTSQRLVLRAEGMLRGWDYSAAVAYNENKLVETLTGGYSNDELITVGLAGGIINPFGPQTATGAEYIAGAALRGELQTAKGRVTSLDVRASREVGRWFGSAPAAALAVGAEVRREKFFDDVNAPVAAQAGSTGVDPDSDVSGSRNVSALYGEFNVPFTNRIDGTVALRHDRYSDFGSTTNPKFALRWRPTDNLLARATWSRGFRAPSLYELYQPNFLTFSAGQYNDPVLCPGGVPAPGADAGRDCNQQFLTQGGGNRNLQPEKARNLTLGIVFEPIAGTTLGVDFWRIRLTNSISTFPEQAIFGDPVTYASRFVRAPGGELAYFVATNDNLGDTRTEGLDLQAAHRMRFMGGNLSLAATGTYVMKYEYQREIGGPFIQNVGRFSDAGAIFRWKHTLQATYARESWSLGVAQRFHRGYDDENFVEPEFGNRVGDYDVWDVYGSYSPMKALTLNVGVRNVFDKDPPYSNQTQTFQAGYDPRYADPTGRAFFVRATYAFR